MEEIKRELKEMKNMLRAVVNAQSSLKQDILGVKKDLRRELGNEITKVREEVKKNGKRIDMLGEQLNEVDEDAPTGEEFKALEKRVTKVETKLASY